MSFLNKIGIVVITLLIITFIYFQLKNAPFYATKQTSPTNEEQRVKIGVSPKSNPKVKKQFNGNSKKKIILERQERKF